MPAAEAAEAVEHALEALAAEDALTSSALTRSGARRLQKLPDCMRDRLLTKLLFGGS